MMTCATVLTSLHSAVETVSSRVKYSMRLNSNAALDAKGLRDDQTSSIAR